MRRVLVRHEVCERLAAEAARCAGRPEVGGILIGCYRGHDIDIGDCTEPGVADVSALFSFVRSDPSHQRAATAAWSTSRQTDTFVGEWHTHPSGGPEPSPTDRTTWRRHARENRRAMAFGLVCPGAWQVFLVERNLFGTTVLCMHQVDAGDLGLVFAMNSGGRT